MLVEVNDAIQLQIVHLTLKYAIFKHELFVSNAITDDGTTTPTQDGTMGGNPTTGDATPYVILAVTVAAAAGVMVVAFKRRKA